MCCWLLLMVDARLTGAAHSQLRLTLGHHRVDADQTGSLRKLSLSAGLTGVQLAPGSTPEP